MPGCRHFFLTIIGRRSDVNNLFYAILCRNQVGMLREAAVNKTYRNSFSRKPRIGINTKPCRYNNKVVSSFYGKMRANGGKHSLFHDNFRMEEIKKGGTQTIVFCPLREFCLFPGYYHALGVVVKSI